MPRFSHLGQTKLLHFTLDVFIDIPAAAGTGHSEGQEAASPAAPQEAGQTNLLTVT